MIALYRFELHIIERAANGKSAYPTQVEKKMSNDDFEGTELAPVTKELLGLLNELNKNRDEDHDASHEIFGQKYADKARKGLRVIPCSELIQYRQYLKGLYFQSTRRNLSALYWFNESLKCSR